MSGWVKIPETWFEEEAVDAMSADAITFHLSALADCARNLRDGRVPRRTLRRLRLVDDRDATVRELVTAGWWAPTPDGWEIRDWERFILAASEVEHRREISRQSSERHRRHSAGDHSLCDRCAAVRDRRGDASRDGSVTSPDPNRSDPKGRRGERAGTDSAGAPSGPPPLPLPAHPHAPGCCALPPENRVHTEGINA